MSRCWLVIYLIFVSQLLFSQEITVKGIVTNLQNEPLSGAIIVCEKKEKTATTSKFSISNSEGEWQLEKMEGGKYMLQARHLGFKTTKLAFSPDSVNYLHIQMEEESTTLEEVVVNAYKNAIRKSGDSIIYDTYKFTTGYEYNLKEVLNKLPGISTSSEGDIYYNGTRIDQLLVEEKDVVGNQHKLLGELFLAEHIKAVHIIENYKNRGDHLSLNKSDKVALDVKLTDDALNQWGGKIETGGGYENKFKVAADVFNINRKVSVTFFTRWNTIGKPILSIADYLSLQPSRKRTFENLGNSNLEPQAFQFPNDLTFNNDVVAAANVLIEPSKKHQTKLIFMYGLLNRDSESQLNRIYYNEENAALEGSEFKNHKTRIIQPTINHLWSPSDHFSVEFELPVVINRFETQNLFNGAFNNLPTRSSNDLEEETTEIIPLTIVNYRINTKWFLTASLKHLNNRKKHVLSLADFETIFDTPYSSLVLSRESENNVSSVESELQHTFPDSSLIEFKASFLNQNYMMASSSDRENFFKWDFNSSRQIQTIGGAYTIRKPKFNIEATASGSFVKTELPEADIAQGLYAVKLSATKSFAIKTSLSLNVTVDEKLNDLYQLNDELVVHTNRELSSSEISPTSKVNKKAISLSYVNLNLRTYSQMFISASIHRITNNPYYVTEIVDNYLINKWVASEQEDNLNINAIYTSPLLFKKVRAGVNIFHRNSKIIARDKSEIKVNQSRGGLSLRTKLSGKFNYRFSIAKQINGNGISDNRFTINDITFQPLFDLKKLHLDLTISQRTILINAQLQNRIWKLDFNGSYRVGNFRITLKGDDLLNLSGAMATQNSFAFNYFDERNFIRFPGYVLVGLTYNF